MMASGDEWMTVTKSSKRCAKTKKRSLGTSRSSKGQSGNQVSVVSSSETLSLDDITLSLQDCLQEVRVSRFYQAFKNSLDAAIQALGESFSEIVCYGVGNFGASKGCAPMFQLALALAVREIPSSSTAKIKSMNKKECDSTDTKTSRKSNFLPMYYYDPCMSNQESLFLERNGIRVIQENERGRRRVQHKTLFVMPHCPLTLYCNLIHSNWDQLENVAIFGNLLSAYTNRLGGANANVKLLEQVESFWDETALPVCKEDCLERSGYFEQAFNDSSLTHFQKTKGQATFERPPTSLPIDDDGGETI